MMHRRLKWMPNSNLASKTGLDRRITGHCDAKSTNFRFFGRNSKIELSMDQIFQDIFCFLEPPNKCLQHIKNLRCSSLLNRFKSTKRVKSRGSKILIFRFWCQN